MAIMTVESYWPALEKLGLADESTKRVVLDFHHGHVPVAYIERFVDDRILSVLQTLEGVEIKRDEVKP